MIKLATEFAKPILRYLLEVSKLSTVKTYLRKRKPSFCNLKLRKKYVALKILNPGEINS